MFVISSLQSVKLKIAKKKKSSLETKKAQNSARNPISADGDISLCRLRERKGLLVFNRGDSGKTKAASRRLLPLPDKVESPLPVAEKESFVGWQALLEFRIWKTHLEEAAKQRNSPKSAPFSALRLREEKFGSGCRPSGFVCWIGESKSVPAPFAGWRVLWFVGGRWEEFS